MRPQHAVIAVTLILVVAISLLSEDCRSALASSEECQGLRRSAYDDGGAISLVILALGVVAYLAARSADENRR